MLNHPIKLNNKILSILELQDELYSSTSLRKLLLRKIKKNKLYDIGNLLNIDNIGNFSRDDLITIIIMNCTNSINYPPCKYYSYTQVPIDIEKIEEPIN
jgi:hypothetical protein